MLVPVAAALKVLLDSENRVSPMTLTQRDDHPWPQEGFAPTFRKAVRAKAGVQTFHDLGDTAVTRLAFAEYTEAAIATVNGPQPPRYEVLL